VAFVAVFFSALIGMTYVFAPQVLFGYLTVASAFWLVVDHALLGPDGFFAVETIGRRRRSLWCDHHRLFVMFPP
jgi:hypothetical protein